MSLLRSVRKDVWSYLEDKNSLLKMMPFHGRCGIQTTQWRLIFDHERVVVTAMINVVNDARKVQRDFLRKKKRFFSDKMFG